MVRRYQYQTQQAGFVRGKFQSTDGKGGGDNPKSKSFVMKTQIEVYNLSGKHSVPKFLATGLLVLGVKLMEINVATAVFQVYINQTRVDFWV